MRAEEGGLAGAIGPDEAEPVGARDEERDLGEEFAGAVGLGNVGDGEHENHTANASGGRFVNRALRAAF